jgi:hypothetical protein
MSRIRLAVQSLKRLSIYVAKFNIAPSRTPTTRQKTLRLNKMQAYSEPTVDRNKCWFCLYSNTSAEQVCNECQAPTPPTRTTDHKEITYRIFSFGSRANSYSGCEKLRASHFQQAIELLQAGTLVAIRVGVAPMYAILIKDANGAIRFSTRGMPPPTSGNHFTQFLHVGLAILATDPQPTTGKIAKINSNIIVLNPLTRFYIDNNLRPSDTSDYSTSSTSSEYSGLYVARAVSL